jgi:exodeoxyribonuclease X
MNTIILDTETTGISSEDRICQLSFIVLDSEHNIIEIHDELSNPMQSIQYPKQSRQQNRNPYSTSNLLR